MYNILKFYSSSSFEVHVVLQAEKDMDNTYLCISDFVAPKESGVVDYIGMFAVTCGLGCRELCSK